MNFLSRLFGSKKSSHNELDDLPPLYGGDGNSPQNPVIVNCCSVNSKDILINSFLEEKHGVKGTDWQSGFEYFVNEGGVPEYSIRAVTITLADGASRTYYFDISRPMNVAKKLMKPLFDQIEAKQVQKTVEASGTSIVAHMLDPNTGYTRHPMVIGEQIDEETVQKFGEGKNVYIIVAYEKGIPNHIICKREKWEEVKAQHDMIDDAGGSATKRTMDELRKLNSRK